MQELITEIAIYLAIAALLGLILGYLLWGMGSRRRIETARAEAAADVRTSVDGGSSLRKQVDELTHERDRLLHRVEVLSIRVASLMETAGGTENAEDVAEKMGTVRLDVSDNPGDRLDDAARSFPEPGDTADASTEDVSIFEEPANQDPDPDPSDSDVAEVDETATAELRTTDTGDDVAGEKTASGDDQDASDAADDSDATPAASGGLFERWDVEPPLRIRKEPTEAAEPKETSDGADNDTDDMPPVPLRPRRPTQAEDEEIPPLRRRPLFAAAQALKPDAQPTAPNDEVDLPDPADTTAELDQGEPDSAESPSEPKLDTVVGSGAKIAEQVPQAPSLAFAGDPDKADDLTRIKGIGKSTAKSLNALGIWQFDQIAGLGPDSLDTLRGKLSAQMGRSIDKWPEQARVLAGPDDT